MRLSALAIALSLSVSIPALAQTDPTFSANEVKAHVTFLADDLLEGRNAGERGFDIAARYVATRLEALGLKPGGPDGSWYQQVPLELTALNPAKPAAFSFGQSSLTNGKHLLFAPGTKNGDENFAGGTVFVGHGLPSDYKGLDVKGKFVVALMSVPNNLSEAEKQAARNVSKLELAASKGAIGLISMVSPEQAKTNFPWDRAVLALSGAQTELASDKASETAALPQAYMHPDGANLLFGGSKQSAEVIFAEAAKGGSVKGFDLSKPATLTRSTIVKSFKSPNVLGVLPGSDPKLANEYVILTAHLDHDGVRPNAPGEDKIYNGAMDNAAGIATMLEAARAFKQAGIAPKRSILFAAVTAEEDGLLGSSYLAQNTVVGAGKVVANVNLDMPILLYDFTDVVAFGAEYSTLGPIVQRAAAKMNVKLSPDPMPEENLFVRSDHYSFVQAGVPSVFLVSGFANGGEKIFRDFLATHYHQPSDQVTLPFNWEAGAKFAKINYLIASEIANTPSAPLWYAGNEYGDRFAKDAAKAPAPKAPAKK